MKTFVIFMLIFTLIVLILLGDAAMNGSQELFLLWALLVAGNLFSLLTILKSWKQLE